MTREEAVGVIERLPVMSYMKKNEKQTIITTALDMAIEALQEPEIVHCKDCAYWLGSGELKQCGLAGYLIGGRGYCLYGKAGEE